MELPAYHYGQQDTSLDDNLYEEIDTTKHLSTTCEKIQDAVREKTKQSTAKKTGGKQRGVNVVLSIAIVAVLALAVIAIVVSVLLTSNSNQEIQSLQLEIENLREMLNQTGDNSNQEIQSLQLDIDNLRGMLNESGDSYNKELQSLTLEIEMLNQTGDNSSQEIQSLQLEIENLREMLNQTGDNYSNQEIQSLQLEMENLREMLNQTGDNSNQEIQSLQLEIENLREMLNQTGDNSNQEIQSLQLEIENLREMLNQTGDNSSQEIQSLQLEIENLREMLNQTGDSLAIQVSTLRKDNQERDDDLTREVQYLNNTVQQLRTISGLFLRGTIENPASSCSDIPQNSPSGEYWIQTNNTNSPVQVYCDMTSRKCSCNTTGGWTRVANFDMTDPSQQCPDGFRLVHRTTAPLRTCGRPGPIGCVSTTFPVHGIEYSHVCGRIRGYQDSTTEAFYSNIGYPVSIDDNYVNGASLTHGELSRQHIWTFAAAADETTSRTAILCPCTRPSITYTGTIPPYVGNDYFCETAARGRYQYIFYPDDPLWDGQGCGGTSTCCSFNNPPWFCKQLPQPTTDDIELRLCADQVIANEDTPLEMVEIYIK